MVFCFPGAMTSHTRHLRIAYKTIRSIQDDSKYSRAKVDVLISMANDQKEENRELLGRVKAKIPDMSEFFPLPDSKTLDRFLDESDGMYSHRVAQLESMILPCISVKQNLFGTALLNTFFSQEFINSHSWPTTG